MNLKLPMDAYTETTDVDMELEGKNLEKARLEWTKETGKTIEYHEVPSIKKGTVATGIKELAFYYTQRIKFLKERFIQNPQDTSATHQIRVSIRSLRSIISFIKPYFEADKYKEYQNALREIAKRFSVIRQYDVIIKKWEAIIEENESDIEDGKVLLKLLKEERLKEQNIAVKWLENEDIEPILSEVSLWIKSFDVGSDKGETEDFFEKRLEKHINDVHKRIIKLSSLDLEEIHTLRLKGKKARY